MNEKKERQFYFSEGCSGFLSPSVSYTQTPTHSLVPSVSPKLCVASFVVVVVVITMYVEIRFFLVFTPLLDIETLQDHISISIYPMVHWYSLLLLLPLLLLSVFFFIIKYSIFTSFLNYSIYIYIYNIHLSSY